MYVIFTLLNNFCSVLINFRQENIRWDVRTVLLYLLKHKLNRLVIKTIKINMKEILLKKKKKDRNFEGVI